MEIKAFIPILEFVDQKKSIQYLKREGFPIGYLVRGKGFPCIVIGSCVYYPRTFPQNFPGLQFIFIDQRAFVVPEKDVSMEDFTIEKIIDDIESVRLSLGLEKFILMGHSIHSFFALEYAKKYPQFVKSIVFIANSPFAGPKLFQEADRYFQESVCPERKQLLELNLQTMNSEIEKNPEKGFLIRMLKFAPMIWYKPDFDASFLWQDVYLNPIGAQTVWGSMFLEYDIKKNLDTISCPILLTLGRYDYWNPPHLWENYRNDFSHLQIRIFEKSGHNPQFEEMDLFWEEVYRFLK